MIRIIYAAQFESGLRWRTNRTEGGTVKNPAQCEICLKLILFLKLTTVLAWPIFNELNVFYIELKNVIDLFRVNLAFPS